MNCSHCLNDCKPDGIDIKQETFNQFIKFLQPSVTTLPVPILISGGEPTLHPDWFNLVKFILEQTKHPVCLLSNGMFLDNDEQVEKLKQLLQFKTFKIQLTHDPRFYPIHINYKKAKQLNLSVEKNIRCLLPIGRAKKNNLKGCINKYSDCFNAMFAKKQKPQLNFWQIINAFCKAGKFCFPLITPEGDIKLGQSFFCKSAGTIYQDEVELSENILLHNCNLCGLKNSDFEHDSKTITV